MTIILVLCKRTFLWDCSIKPLRISTKVINHITSSDPVHLLLLCWTDFLVLFLCPPIIHIFQAASVYTALIILSAFASIILVVLYHCFEWCEAPVGLNTPFLGGPVVCIPKASISFHGLCIWVIIALMFSVDSNWFAIYHPPENVTTLTVKASEYFINSIDSY